MALSVQGFDALELVGRQQVAFGTVDTHHGGDGLGGMRIVTGQHDSLDAQLVQLGDGLATAFLDRVGHREQRQRAGAVEQQHHGLALAFQRIQLCLQLGRAQPQLLDQTVVTQVVNLTRDGTAHATPSQGGEVIDLAQGQALLLAELGNGA